MGEQLNPYDELPYRSAPIEWSAPERLAVTSLLHGGPRVRLDRYRMLELGCGDGTNLLALAYYRPHASFVGVDGSARHIESARARASDLHLDNLTFLHTDLRDADAQLDGRFEFIVAHGVISWVPDDARDAVLAIHRTRLAPNGIVYLNYNAEPGWSVRGLVRDFLLAQTRDADGLLARSLACKVVSATLAEVLARSEHAWSQLMAAELRIVAGAEPSYIAHEYLSPENRRYWRSEFAALASAHGLVMVGDADFDQLGGAADPSLDAWLETEAIQGRALEDTSDLVRFRQLHSPLLTPAPWAQALPGPDEIGDLFVASSLALQGDDRAGQSVGRGVLVGAARAVDAGVAHVAVDEHADAHVDVGGHHDVGVLEARNPVLRVILKPVGLGAVERARRRHRVGAAGHVG